MWDEHIHCHCKIVKPLRFVSFMGFIMASVGIVFLFVWASMHALPPPQDIQLASMDFTVLNITENRLSAKWDLSINIPEELAFYYLCPQGDVQASFLYKNVTLATSSQQKYNNLYRKTKEYKKIKYHDPQYIDVSALVSDELIGEDIIEDIENKKEVQFTSLFSLTDCRNKTTGVINYACYEVTLRFEPSEMKAHVFGEVSECGHF